MHSTDLKVRFASDLLLAVAVTFTMYVDTEVTVAVSTLAMSSARSFVFSDTALFRIDVRVKVSVTVVVSETFRVSVIVRGFEVIAGEAGQVLVA